MGYIRASFFIELNGKFISDGACIMLFPVVYFKFYRTVRPFGMDAFVAAAFIHVAGFFHSIFQAVGEKSEYIKD